MTEERTDSEKAYRPIGEVAELLRLQPHVLRFWESKFTQIKPLKRNGGRRYYRSEDVRLLFKIRDLLYVERYTLRGAQKLLSRSKPAVALQPPPQDLHTKLERMQTRLQKALEAAKRQDTR